MSESTKPAAGHTNGDQLSQLLAVSSTVLQQALDLVDNVLTDDDQLTVQSKYLPGSTIGLFPYIYPVLSLTSMRQGNTYAMHGITSLS